MKLRRLLIEEPTYRTVNCRLGDNVVETGIDAVLAFPDANAADAKE